MPIPTHFGSGFDMRRTLLQRIAMLPVDPAIWRRVYRIAEKLALGYAKDRLNLGGVDVFLLDGRCEICVYSQHMLRAFVIATPHDGGSAPDHKMWSYAYEQDMYDESHGPVLATGDLAMPIALDVWRGAEVPGWMQPTDWMPKEWSA